MRIGVIGAGVIGKLRAQSIVNNSSTQLAGVFDVSLDAAKKVAGSAVPAFDTLEAFLGTDMDAVFISTPTHVHEEACIAELAGGRHVLCEKPLAHTLDASEKIVAAAKQAGVVLTVGFNLRYYPAIEYAKEALDKGLIGELDHLRIFGGHEGLPKFRVDWQYKAPESGGGAMWDVGIHMTDLARYFLGEITEVYGIASERTWRVPGSEDNAMAIFKNPSGIAASYQATWSEWKGYQFFVEAYGTHGMVRGSYAPMRNLLITHDGDGDKRKTVHKYYPEIMIREKFKTWHSTALLSFSKELEDFLALTQGKRNLRIADANAGLRSIEIAYAVNQSNETGEPVKLPELDRTQ